ncbi:MAG: hypothetical protein KDD42_04510 [Bdellovibrionales bacterium]|nr:hypothetical protein [Bdellovibrionales bacterium]
MRDTPILESNQELTSGLEREGLWQRHESLRLHLGCGENYFPEYVNIDYPPDKHNVMLVKADLFADITQLLINANTVDEIRLHHVFEHFNRVTALAMLIKWQMALKPGGKLHIETPDVEGCAQNLLADTTWEVKMAAIRHLAGDQAGSWAYHVDHWFPARFHHTLTELGFVNVETRTSRWDASPFIPNVHAIAYKGASATQEQLLSIADKLLWESTLSPAEAPTYEVWRTQLRASLKQPNLEDSASNTTMQNALQTFSFDLDPSKLLL